MKEYTCIYPKLEADRCLLISKSKQFNLVGGKIEKGERVEDAAKRELLEESCLEGLNFRIRGALTNKKAVVWFLTCDITINTIQSSQEGEVQWYWFDEAIHLLPLAPHLKLIIPLLETQAPDWKITETKGGLKFVSCNWESL